VWGSYADSDSHSNSYSDGYGYCHSYNNCHGNGNGDGDSYCGTASNSDPTAAANTGASSLGGQRK